MPAAIPCHGAGHVHQHAHVPDPAPPRRGQPGASRDGQRDADRSLGGIRAPLRRDPRRRVGPDRDRVLLDAGGPVPGTVGVPCDRFAARVVGPEGIDAAPGEAGELWIKPIDTHVIFEGYAGAGAGGPDVTDDGWYRTGDLLARGAEGAFSFHGRLREAIRRRGETIAPAEIEAVAVHHPGVRDAAAVGVPADDGVEDEILLCVVLNDPPAVTPANLHAHLMDELPRFMVPRFIRI